MRPEDETRSPTPTPLVLPFPTPGDLIRLAYRELHIAINGTEEEKHALGYLQELPRPWEPATCREPGLRTQLWDWLEEIVIWLNREYTWDVTGLIPCCWPLHPHLVHEIAVLADQRRRAGLALTSDALEEWHRYSLPAFTERLRSRTRSHCEDQHRSWPAKPLQTEHLADVHVARRNEMFAADVDRVLKSPHPSSSGRAHSRPRLVEVDLVTGEIKDERPRPDPRTRTERGPRE